MLRATLATIAILLLPTQDWAQVRSAPVTLTPRGESTSPVVTSAVREVTVTVPAQTEAAVELLSGIHTQVSHVDDPVRAQFVAPVFIDGRVALPPGTLLDGRITRIRTAGRLGRSGEVSIRFETVTLPDGQAQPIAACLTALDADAALPIRLDAEGHLKGSGKSAWKRITGGLVVLGTAATAGAALAGWTALAAVLPVGGTVFASYAFVLPRGNEVHLPPETRLRIRLNQSLTVRVPW